MTKVIGVRFRTAGKIYFFDPLQFEIKRGDHVIVETARGIEFGTVVSGVTEVDDEKVVQPLKPVIRIANQRDEEQEAGNKEKEKDAYGICLEKIQKHGLEMKLIDAEYTFDNNKVLFYFTADGRIDFRELVKDLASVFKTRIELRQIGVRDETKIVGGIGICGRPLCCHSYLSDFVPVSIKMAKEQNLSLNPTKISGVCGRLMCCLKNEEDTYEELNRRLPGIGDSVVTDDGLRGEVQSVNVLRQLVKVVVDVGDEKEIREYEVDRLSFKRRHGKKENVELSKEELKELERLEEEEEQEIQESEGRQENSLHRGGSRQERRREEKHQENNQHHNERQEGRPEEAGQENDRYHNGREGQQENDQYRNNRDGQHRGSQDRQYSRQRQDKPYNRQCQDRQDNRRQDGQRQEGYQRRDNRDGQRRDGQDRQDNRRPDGQRQDRPYNRQRQDRQDKHRQDVQRQEGYQRRDYKPRYRHDTRPRQEGRQRQDDSQS